MKKLVLALAGLSLVGVAPVLADNTDTKSVTVSGEVIASLQLAVVGNMTMPTLVRPGTAPGGGAEPDTTVAITCAGTSTTPSAVTYTNNGNPYARGVAAAASASTSSSNYGAQAVAGYKTGVCAQLTVTGQSGAFFNVSTSTTNPTAVTGLTITNATCYKAAALIAGPGSNGVTIGGGSQDIYCGATLTALASGGGTGTFTDGAVAVTVTYD